MIVQAPFLNGLSSDNCRRHFRDGQLIALNRGRISQSTAVEKPDRAKTDADVPLEVNPADTSSTEAGPLKESATADADENASGVAILDFAASPVADLIARGRARGYVTCEGLNVVRCRRSTPRDRS